MSHQAETHFGSLRWSGDQLAIIGGGWIAGSLIHAFVESVAHGGTIPGWDEGLVGTLSYGIFSAVWLLFLWLPTSLLAVIGSGVALPHVPRSLRRALVLLVVAGLQPIFVVWVFDSLSAASVSPDWGHLAFVGGLALAAVIVRLPGQPPLPGVVSAGAGGLIAGAVQFLLPFVMFALVPPALVVGLFSRSLLAAGVFLIASLGPWTVIITSDLFRPDVPALNYLFAGLGNLTVLLGVVLLILGWPRARVAGAVSQ